MLQEPSDNAPYANVLAEAGDPGAEPALAADDEVDLHAGGGRRVEGADHLRVVETVQLHDHAPLPARLDVGNLALDPGGEGPSQVAGRDDEFLVLLVGGVPGQVVEQVHRVAADLRTRREDPDVRINLSRLGVVVAGADVAVGADLVPFLADDERDLRVRLQPDEAVRHVDARLLQHGSPLHVVGLVEAGRDLHEHGDRLARLGRPNERGDDPRVLRRPVERLLDGHDRGVRGGLLDELLHRRGERLVRVVHHEIARPDHREDVGTVLRLALADQARRDHRLPGFVPVLPGPLGGDLPEARHLEQSRDLVQVFLIQLELANEELPHVVGHARLDLESNDAREAPLAKLLRDHLQEVVRHLFVPGHVRVAGDAEEGSALDLHPPEEFAREVPHDLLDGDHVPALREFDPAQRGGDLHPGEVAGPAFRVLEHQGEREAHVGEEGERVSRIDGQRREDRINSIREHATHLLAFLLVQILEVAHGDVEFRSEARPEFLLPDLGQPSPHGADALPHEIELFGGPQAVQRRLHHARPEHALEAADLLHHEFVEVVLRDGEETEPLQQRGPLVHGLVEHAPVEIQPAEFRVEVERRVVRLRVIRNGRRNRRSRQHRDALHAVAELRAGRTRSGVGVTLRGRRGLGGRRRDLGGQRRLTRRRNPARTAAPAMKPRTARNLVRLG